MFQLRRVSFALLALGVLLCSMTENILAAHAAAPQFVAVPVSAAQQATLTQPHREKLRAAAQASINAEITRDLGVAHDAPCLNGRSAFATPQTTPLPDVAVTLNVVGPVNGSNVTLPASFAYTLTIQNIGDAATPKAFTVYFTYGSMLKYQEKKFVIKTLAVNETRQFTGTLVPKAAGQLDIQADAATQCLFAEKDTTNNSSDSRYFTLLAQGVDFTSDGWDVVAQTPHVGDGDVTSGATYSLEFGLSNTGSIASTSDVAVRLSSPLIGTFTVTIPAGQLPTAGNYAAYDVVDSGTATPHIFTAPSVKKVTRYPITVLINPTHKPVETSYANNVSKGSIEINPTGVNLRGIGFMSGDGCYFLTGATTYTITAYVNNGGTQQAGPSKALLYMDKMLLGTFDVPAIAAGSQTTLVFKQPAPVVKTAGTHTITIIVDSAHQISEYNEGDNKHIEKYTFRKTAP